MTRLDDLFIAKRVQMEVLFTIVMGLVDGYQWLVGAVARIFPKLIKQHVMRKIRDFGVEVNGKQPFDIQVKDERFYWHFAKDRFLGAGEAYMNGYWDCEQLDEMGARIIEAGLIKYILALPDVRICYYLRFHLFNMQSSKRAWEVGKKHYDLGNHLYKSFLDPTMTYSCGYWKNAQTLDEAQLHKMDLIARKLKLEPGMRVLDIGCGWGGLCKYLAENYDVHVVGLTVSKEGVKYARDICKNLNVDIRLQDYRDLKDEQFDRVVSVGMFEHVGRQNHRTFFEVASRCLSSHGIFLLHTIGIDGDFIFAVDPWVHKYIFPNGHLPDHRNIAEKIHTLFTIEDWHNFGADYDKTLTAWYGNFVRNWPSISSSFDDPDRFFRMWTFYLRIAAAGFRVRKFHVWQIVLSKDGIPGGYSSVR